jgi:hypothetical protein
MRVNFEPVSDILETQRRDFPLADPTLVEPLNALALVDGEWVTLNSTYQLIRAADVATLGTAAAVEAFPLFSERGRYDTQAMAEKKMDVIYLGDYEFDTRIFDAGANIGGSGNPAIATALQNLKAMTITIGTRNYVGLVGHAGSGDTDPIVGRVTRLPADNGGKLRFKSGSRL